MFRSRQPGTSPLINVTDPAAPASYANGRYANGRFGPGNPGRKAGSRNRAGHRAALAILEDFQANQDEVLTRLRRSWLPAYAKLVAHLLPRQVELDLPDLDAYGDLEVAAVIAQTRAALERIEAGEGSLLELESALLAAAPAGGEPPYQR
jgi:hypothetical protein